jgi:sarcosine oxidase gamma subunit
MIWLNVLPSNISNHAVDISHNMAHFSLRGVEALNFIDHYTIVDFFDLSIRKTQAIRTTINHYTCVIWWENTRSVHLVTDRSLE